MNLICSSLIYDIRLRLFIVKSEYVCTLMIIIILRLKRAYDFDGLKSIKHNFPKSLILATYVHITMMDD